MHGLRAGSGSESLDRSKLCRWPPEEADACLCIKFIRRKPTWKEGPRNTLCLAAILDGHGRERREIEYTMVIITFPLLFHKNAVVTAVVVSPPPFPFNVDNLSSSRERDDPYAPSLFPLFRSRSHLSRLLHYSYDPSRHSGFFLASQFL